VCDWVCVIFLCMGRGERVRLFSRFVDLGGRIDLVSSFDACSEPHDVQS
jgi:hypothetical protein